MRIFIPLLFIMAGIACSNSPDILKAAIWPTTHFYGPSPLYRSSAIPATAGVGSTLPAEEFAVETPAATRKDGLLDISIVGLDLLTGESATLFANNCEVMRVTNHADVILRRLNTRIRMTQPTSANGIVRVESAGRQVSSHPITVSPTAIACNRKQQLVAISEIDFSNYAEKLATTGKSIKMDSSFNQGTAGIQAHITHPSRESGRSSYITHLSVQRNQQQILSIKSTPLLDSDPTIGLVFDIVYVNDEISVLWRDNTDKVDKASLQIQFNQAE